MLVCLFSSDDSNVDLLSHVTDSDNSEPIRVIIRNLSGQILDENEIPGDRLLSALPTMPTLERVKLQDMIGDVADSFILAAIENEAIHTVEMEAVFCSADVFRAVLKRKRRVHIYKCFMKPNMHEGAAPITAALVDRSDTCACQMQEFEIRCSKHLMTMLQALENIQENMFFPALRRISVVHCGGWFENELLNNMVFQEEDYVDPDDTWIQLTNILKVAPLLEVLHIQGFSFPDGLKFQTFANNINYAPCPLLHWSLSDCSIMDEALDVLGDIVCRDNARLTQFCIGPSNNYLEEEMLPNVLKIHSCVTELAYWPWMVYTRNCAHGDRGLRYILQALEGRQGQPTCEVTTIQLHLVPMYPKLYLDLIQSVPCWTPDVKNLLLGCSDNLGHYSLINFFPDDAIRSKFLQAVRENFHLQVIDLECGPVPGNDDLEKSRRLLHLYSERNRRFRDVVNNPFTLPVYLWPFILHIADRAGRDFVYQFLIQSAV